MYDTTSSAPTLVTVSRPQHVGQEEPMSSMSLNNSSRSLHSTVSTGVSSSSLSLKNKKKRRVQFAVDSFGDVRASVHTVHENIKPRDHAKIWFSQKELDKTASEANKLVKMLKRDKNYCWAVSLQYRYNTKAGVSERDDIKARSILRQYAADGARGLEKRVDSTTSTAILSRHKKNTIAVAHSDKGKKSGTYLRSQAKSTSGMGRDFSAAMGKFDAWEMRDLKNSSAAMSSHSELVLDSLLA